MRKEVLKIPNGRNIQNGAVKDIIHNKSKEAASARSFKTSEPVMNNSFLVISDNRVIHKIPIAQIDIVQSKGKRCCIHTASGDILTCSKNVGVIIKEVCKFNIFFRVDTSYAVNLHKILRVKKEKKTFVIMSNGSVLPVSKRRRSGFFERYLALPPNF